MLPDVSLIKQYNQILRNELQRLRIILKNSTTDTLTAQLGQISLAYNEDSTLTNR